jgi:hypothetical protein
VEGAGTRHLEHRCLLRADLSGCAAIAGRTGRDADGDLAHRDDGAGLAATRRATADAVGGRRADRGARGGPAGAALRIHRRCRRCAGVSRRGTDGFARFRAGETMATAGRADRFHRMAIGGRRPAVAAGCAGRRGPATGGGQQGDRRIRLSRADQHGPGLPGVVPWIAQDGSRRGRADRPDQSGGRHPDRGGAGRRDLRPRAVVRHAGRLRRGARRPAGRPRVPHASGCSTLRTKATSTAACRIRSCTTIEPWPVW